MSDACRPLTWYRPSTAGVRQSQKETFGFANPDQVGFAAQPRRLVVERFFAWINRNRQLAKDFEATIDPARAFFYAASVMLLVRRLARPA